MGMGVGVGVGGWVCVCVCVCVCVAQVCKYSVKFLCVFVCVCVCVSIAQMCLQERHSWCFWLQNEYQILANSTFYYFLVYPPGTSINKLCDLG